MKRHFVVLLIAIRMGSRGVAEENQPRIASLGDLQQHLSNHISQAKFSAALWAVKIVSLDTGKTLFEHNAQKLFSPASNSKLYSVALALDRLGPDYRIRTSVYGKSKPDEAGVLTGDLVLYGRGNPTINARLHKRGYYQAF